MNKTIAVNSLKASVLSINAFVLSWTFQYVCLGKPNYLLANFLFVLAVVFYRKARLYLNIFGLVLALGLPGAKVIGTGVVQNAIVDVIFGTSIDEIIGFHAVLPTKLILSAAALFAYFALMICFNRRLCINQGRKLKIAIALLLVISAPLFAYRSYAVFSDRISDIITAYKFITDKSEPIKGQWQVQENGKKQFDTYVVLIGESMRSDFMSLYGFSVNTTPNLITLPHKAIDGMIAPSPCTALSVPLFLSVHDESQAVTNNNAVNLAQSAGFDTYWISSQGYSGDNNYPSALIARYAKHTYFTTTQDDYQLLPEIEKALKSDGRKVIFVHIMGSHENPCSRLFDYGIKYDFDIGKSLNCYLSTYNRTDDFIMSIVRMLESDSDRHSYALSYFSDHGLNYVNDGDEYAVFRDMYKKQQYMVPFYVTDSDMNDRTVIRHSRSALNFMDFYADWLGLYTNFTIKDYDIFKDEDDEKIKVSLLDRKFADFSIMTDGVSAQDIEKKTAAKDAE